MTAVIREDHLDVQAREQQHPADECSDLLGATSEPSGESPSSATAADLSARLGRLEGLCRSLMEVLLPDLRAEVLSAVEGLRGDFERHLAQCETAPAKPEKPTAAPSPASLPPLPPDVAVHLLATVASLVAQQGTPPSPLTQPPASPLPAGREQATVPEPASGALDRNERGRARTQPANAQTPKDEQRKQKPKAPTSPDVPPNKPAFVTRAPPPAPPMPQSHQRHRSQPQISSDGMNEPGKRYYRTDSEPDAVTAVLDAACGHLVEREAQTCRFGQLLQALRSKPGDEVLERAMAGRRPKDFFCSHPWFEYYTETAGNGQAQLVRLDCHAVVEDFVVQFLESCPGNIASINAVCADLRNRAAHVFALALGEERPKEYFAECAYIEFYRGQLKLLR